MPWVHGSGGRQACPCLAQAGKVSRAGGVAEWPWAAEDTFSAGCDRPMPITDDTLSAGEADFHWVVGKEHLWEGVLSAGTSRVDIGSHGEQGMGC